MSPFILVTSQSCLLQNLKTSEHTLIRGVRPKKNPGIAIKTSNMIVSAKRIERSNNTKSSDSESQFLHCL